MNDTEQIILDKLKELDGKVDKIAEQNERIARLEEKQESINKRIHSVEKKNELFMGNYTWWNNCWNIIFIVLIKKGYYLVVSFLLFKSPSENFFQCNVFSSAVTPANFLFPSIHSSICVGLINRQPLLAQSFDA